MSLSKPSDEKDGGDAAIKMFALTIKIKKDTMDEMVPVIKKCLMGLMITGFKATNWQFQTELGFETGYLHFQVEFRTEAKIRIAQLARLLKHTPLEGKLTRMSGNCKTFKYTEKIMTRIAGPWSDKDDDSLKMEVEAVVGKNGCNLWKWQRDLLSPVPRETKRQIIWIYNKWANSGKSTFLEYCRVFKLAQYVPNFGDTTKIMGWIATLPKNALYIVDLPMASNLSEKKMAELAVSLEHIKDGLMFDWRYGGKDDSQVKPRIIALANCRAPRRYWAADRPREFMIGPYDRELVEHSDEREKKLDNAWAHKRQQEAKSAPPLEPSAWD